MQKGKKFKKGTVIGIVGPANNSNPEDIQRGKTILENLDYEVVIGKSCTEKWYNFAGNDKLRADDINKMFADNKIDAIMALRGGYGSLRILDMIDYGLIKNNPKLFIGFSDITSLHIAFNKFCDLITVHGPMLVSKSFLNLDDFTTKSFADLVTGKTNYIENPEIEKIHILSKGACQGPIIGGNLELIRCSLGTPYEIDVKNKILFIEEVKEYTYRIDRAFMQLKLAGKFDDCIGIILGDFGDCEKQNEDDFKLMEIFEDFFDEFNKPVIYNLKSGHCSPMISLPFGCRCEMIASSDAATLKLLEEPVA